MREIVLDTETTGLSPKDGHRVVEIGCVELLNYMPTGATWHRYLNPERDIPAQAAAIHGLTAEFLSRHPVFTEIASEFLEFIGDSGLIIHNAEFDMAFLNWELRLAGRSLLPNDRALDTLSLARKRFPGAPANLDDLCRRFDIDNSGREFHGALLDASLLAEVYLELRGGRQTVLDLSTVAPSEESAEIPDEQVEFAPVLRPARSHSPSPEEIAAHEAFVAELDDPLWVSLGLCGDGGEKSAAA